MKVICDRGALSETLAIVSGVIVARSPKPVLGYLKVSAENGVLTLSASDMEVSVKVSTPRVEVQEPGVALLPADKLNSIVRESLDTTLMMTTDKDDQKTTIRGVGSRFEVYGLPVSDFPPIPEFDGKYDFQIEAGLLKKVITQTIFATAKENSRFAINGVMIERQDTKLTVVATDGRRLAVSKTVCQPFTAGDANTISIIVPCKALNLLLKTITGADALVKVKLSDNQIVFATDDVVLTSNLVEGNFPPFKDVIPTGGDKKAVIATAELASGVRRAALLTNEESKGVRMAFAGEKLTLRSRAPETGEAEVEVALSSYTGEPVEIGFNPHFILDALKVADSEQVELELKSSNKPGLLRTGPDFLYVVMPVNLQ
jgi:DNA polymerase III subunit beta